MWEAGESNPLFMANKISKSSLDFMGKKCVTVPPVLLPHPHGQGSLPTQL